MKENSSKNKLFEVLEGMQFREKFIMFVFLLHFRGAQLFYLAVIKIIHMHGFQINHENMKDRSKR